MFHRFEQALLGYGGLILGLSKFQLLKAAPKIVAHAKNGQKWHKNHQSISVQSKSLIDCW